MDFYTILDQVVDLLRHRKRVTYRALQRQFNLDDTFLNDLKAELIEAQHLAADEDGNVLVWIGDTGIIAASHAPQTAPQSMPNQRKPYRVRLRPSHILSLTPNGANSPSCSVTW